MLRELSIFLVGCTLATAEKTFPAAKLGRLSVTSTNGDVKVRAVRAAQARVTPSSSPGGGVPCTVEATVRDGTLEIRIGDTGPAGCHSDVEVAVPARLDIDITANAGDVFVSGVRGALTVQVGRGSAVVGGRLSSLKARIEHGSLSATGLAGNADIKLESGNAQLWYDTLPRQGGVLLDVGHGNVTIAVPTAPCATRVQLLKGSVQGSVSTTAGAAFVIDGVIAEGNLYLRRAAER